MLSRRALLFAGLVTLVGVVATWLHTPALELLWRAMLVAAIGAAIADGVLASRIRVRGSITGNAPLPLGREVPIHIDLQVSPARRTSLAIRTLLVPELRTADRVQACEFPDAGSAALCLDVRAVALGDRGDLALLARALGPLGLTWWRLRIPLDRTLRVVPDPATRSGQRRSSSDAGFRIATEAGYGVEIRQLRPYRSGDPQRSIDWKASARSGGLITREVEAEHRQEIMLFIDLGRGSRTEIDSLPKLGHNVNLASKLIQLASLTDDQVGLIAFAGEPLIVRPPIRAATSAHTLQRELAGLASHAEESNPLLAMLRLQGVVRHRTLIVVMTDLDDAAVSTQLTTALRLVARRHLPLVVDFDSSAVAALETIRPVSWRDPYVALAAQEFRQRQRASALRLARLGCKVLLTHPETAERELARTYAAVRAQHRL